jgi:hypothetical protein
VANGIARQRGFHWQFARFACQWLRAGHMVPQNQAIAAIDPDIVARFRLRFNSEKLSIYKIT